MAREHVVMRADVARSADPDAVEQHVRGTADVSSVVAAAVAGHRVVAVVHDDALLDLVTAELRRVGPGVLVDEQAPVDESTVDGEAAQILSMLAEGLTIGQAARRLNVSPRTATRRLERARRALGVETTAAAVTAFLRAEGADGPTPSLVGRGEVIDRLLALTASDTPVLVLGEGAVGKTAVLTAVERSSQRPVHRAGGQATLGWVDFWVVARAARLDSREGDVEAVASRVEHAVGPDLLVVDDVHLCDPGSISVLTALVGRVAMLTAARPGEPVVDQLADAGFHVETLPPLATRDVAVLARRYQPDLTSADLDRIVAGSAGLPLLVEFLCRADRNGVRGRGLVPAVEGLSPTEQRSALRLALSDRALPTDGSSGALVERGIATRQGSAVRIRHALVADAVVEHAGREMMLSVLRDLQQEAWEDGDFTAAAEYAAKSGDHAAATNLALRAAEDSTVAGDRAQLLAVAARNCRDERGGALDLAAVEALSMAGRHREVLALLDSPRWGTPAQQAAAALALARAQWHLGEAEAALASARSGLDVVAGTGSAQEAALIREIVRCDVLLHGIARPEHIEMLVRARAIAEEGGYPLASQFSVEGIVAHFQPGVTSASTTHFAEGRALAQVEGDLDTYLRCTNNLISMNLEDGDPLLAADLAVEMGRAAATAGLGEWRAQALAMSANLAYHQGRYAKALSELDELDGLAVDERTQLQATETRAAVLLDLGMLDAALDVLPDLSRLPAEDWLTYSASAYLTAFHSYWSGQPRRALATLAPLQELPLEIADRWFVELLAAWARYDAGEAIEAPDAVAGTTLRHGLALHTRAVAVLSEDPERAVAAFDEAAEFGRGWTYALSRLAAWGAAEAARLSGRADAVDRLLAIEKEAMEAGLMPLLAKVHRSLRLAGVRRSARRSVDRSGLLTERERLVVDLLADGSTYDEVARRLGVGRSTVRRLLVNAQGKLGRTGKFATVAAVRA